MKMASLIAGVMAGLFCVAAVAHAGEISGIGGAPSWPNWVGPSITDFEAQPTGFFNATIIGNTKFIGVDGQMQISTQYAGQYNTNGNQSLQSQSQFDPIFPHTIEFDFTNPVAAVAWNWGAADNAWLMSAYDNSNNLIESHVITLPYSGIDDDNYFGIEAAGIKKIVLVDQLDNYPNGDYVFIDDFTTSFEVAPEPAMLAPILVGAFALIRRR